MSCRFLLRRCVCGCSIGWNPAAATYNIPSCFRLKGKFNLAAFEQSLTEIVRRHEALRTCFLMVDGRPVQKIASPEPFQVSVVDLQGLPEAARKEEAARLALVDARQPFDLGKAPLMRATLLKLAAEEQVLLLNMHHIAFDGWSFGVFERELSVLYKAFLQGKPSPLPELPIQYADFAVWQREWLQGEVLQTQLDYWKEKLRGDPTGSGTAEGPSASRPPDLQWVDSFLCAFPGTNRGAENFESAGGGHPLRHVAGGLPGSAAALHGARRPPGGDADCQPESGRDRGADWIVREHAGDAERLIGESEFSGVVGASPGDGARRLRTPGLAV